MTLIGRAKSIAVVAMAATLMTACDTDVVYDSYCHAPTEGWEKTDTLQFNVPRMAEGGRYRMEIGMRTNSSFPFTGITVVVDQVIEPRHRLQSDTINCRIADKDGNILGRGVSFYQYDFILNDTDLRRGDSLNIRIRHIMRREVVPGVADVGVKITKR